MMRQGKPRIYADYHGLCPSPRDRQKEGVLLDTHGSARDLANYGIRPIDGTELVVWADSDVGEDLENDAIAFFDHESKRWVAELQDETRYVPTPVSDDPPRHLCVKCRVPFPVDEYGFAAVNKCSNCGASPWAAIDPPDEPKM